MHILISNDDGYRAPGIVLLAQRVSELAQVTVVAPDRDRSGASNSLTLDNPLRVARGEGGFFVVDLTRYSGMQALSDWVAGVGLQ